MLSTVRSAIPTTNTPAEPVLLRSSETLGWTAVTARVYDEPPTMELWRPPPTPMLTLGLVTSGSMNLEQRHPCAPWVGQIVHPQHFFLQSYHEPYELRWQNDCVAPIQTLILKLEPQTVLRTIAEVTEHDPACLLFIEHIGFDDPLLLQLALALQHELDHPTAIGRLYEQTATQMLVVHLLRQYSTLRTGIWEPTRGLSNNQVRRIQDFVRDHLQQDLSLAVLAQHISLSPYYFARMFRQATGESVHQFVLRQRLEHAQWLLQTTDVAIVQIAEQCGFANQSYLSTVFKRYTGITPKKYRQQVQ